LSQPANPSRAILVAALCCVATYSAARAQGVEVSATVVLQRPGAKPTERGSANVVVWLTPLDSTSLAAQPQQHYTLEQKDKMFQPHLLVVPVGSSVDFPNLDPFFHNVFSLFNGKRFDLGLYEGHSHRAVRFDREGVSYIFCNIHPDMGAVVISLSTPFYAVSQADGRILLKHVPPGRYRLHLWAENVDLQTLHGLSRDVQVDEQNNQLGTFHLQVTARQAASHKNKFGEDYVPAPKTIYP
jgi:plastocyanin